MVEIAKHFLDALQRDMNSMHVQLIEIIMEHNVLHEKLVGTQRRVNMLEQKM
jgi:vacuolar-type H+-ATPase subunit D/Vma8